MRRIAWALLLLCTFTIPWEYSLDFGPPLGNIARLLAIAALLGTVLTVLQEGRFRSLRTVHVLISVYVLWLICSILWSIDRTSSVEKVRGNFQECMITWLVWELAESVKDVREILFAWVAGSWVLAGLTVAKLLFWSADANQLRFAAFGWDPNDTARFLDLGFPAAAMLLMIRPSRLRRWLALFYFPAAAIAVAATGSRGGAAAAIVAWIGCGVVYLQRHRKVTPLLAGIPLLILAGWFLIPHETAARIATISGQVQGGDLNQRETIWHWGWEAAKDRPLTGYGAGTFSFASGLVPTDTAHNTTVAILIESGLVGLWLASAVFMECLRMAWATGRGWRVATGTMLAVWATSSVVGTAAESRTTWVMVGLIAVLARLRAGGDAASGDVRSQEQGSRELSGFPRWETLEAKLGNAN